jgi:hypothetical protein
MKKMRKYFLLWSLVAVICALFAAAKVRATGDGPVSLPLPVAGDTLAFSCTISNVAKIELLSVETEVCTGSPTGRCSKYSYRGSSWGSGNSRSLLFSVSADIGIRATSAPAGFTTFVIQKGVEEPVFDVGEKDFGQRWVRFSAPSVFTGDIDVSITTDESQPVAGTAAGKVGTKKGFCSSTSSIAIATPGKSVTEQNQGLTNVVRSQAGPCTVDRTLDARGRTINMALVPPSDPGQCPIGEFDVTIAGDSNVDTFISPESQITFGNHTRYCFASARGGVTCVGTP